MRLHLPWGLGTVFGTGLILILVFLGRIDGGPLPPSEALKQFKVADDLQLELVLCEPAVCQPISLSFDERGRLWVVQYRQYPDPAGLKELSRDKFWRVVYDKVPPPPPNHFKGKDRITIHEDTDGDGFFDKHKTFLDGLNIVTSVARGRGGVWVLNPPYLLFYPDRDNDDVPDGNPEVHLEGFGLEDTHSCVNSLRWGPDGWLYAAQGSTVSGQVRRPGLDKNPVYSMGQQIWRYHPETRRYEVFAEGGGNAFGVEIDSKGRIYSGHNGGDTRGFHYIQGGYFQKGFSKHGPLSNPYTFGYYTWMKHARVPRFTHTFLVEEGGKMPERHRGKLFGVAPLQSHVVEAELLQDGSSFQTRDIGHPVTSSDKWFRPVDIKAGPDGAIYVADFYEAEIAHLRHHEGKIDPTSGRVYRLKARGAEPVKQLDLTKLSTPELIDHLASDNRTLRQTVLRVIGDRKDRSVVPLLGKLTREKTGQLALEALWALHLSGGLDEAAALDLLSHADPYVRAWTVRLLGDPNQVSATVAERLARMARQEPHVEVRSQLACTAKRLPASSSLPIQQQLWTRDEDVADVHVPLMLWWALESKIGTDATAVVKLFEEPKVWRLPLVEQHLLERLMRRFAAEGGRQNLLHCARLLRLAPGQAEAKRLLTGFEQAYTGRSLSNLPAELIDALAARGGGSLSLRLRQGQAEAVTEALDAIANPKADRKQRLQLLAVFGEVTEPRSVPVLLQLLATAQDDELRQAVLAALKLYADAEIGSQVVRRYADFSPDVRDTARTLLASRAAWSLELLRSVDAGKIEASSIPTDVLRRVLLHRDDRLAPLVRKHWGEVKGATTEEMNQQIERFGKALRNGEGSPYAGKKLFVQTCAKCHQLFTQGGNIGPDLTTYQRTDRENLLLHIVNPSAEIREGFENYLVSTADGRALNGFLVEKDDKVVVLRGPDGQNVTVTRDQIEEMGVIPQSLMPEGLLKELNDQQVRDLFAYLRSSQPLND